MHSTFEPDWKLLHAFINTKLYTALYCGILFYFVILL